MTDGSGIDQTESREIGADLFASACLRNRAGLAGLVDRWTDINQNAVYDAARRFSQVARWVSREMLTGYAVIDGKSVLWFRRYYDLPGGSEPIDLWEGIAGAIAPEAPPKGWTNEWLLAVELKPYHSSDSSLWKVNAFTDYFPFLTRAHFYSPEVALDPSLLWHTSYGLRVTGMYPSAGVLAPEAPSGWNYAWAAAAPGGRQWANQKSCGPGDTSCADFAKSNPIYKPDSEIESAEIITEGGVEQVEVTLAGRLQNTEGETGGAPASIAQDRSTWVAATIQAEPWRSDENGIRLYLLRQDDGTNSFAMTGDNALNSLVQSLPDNPMGTIFPEFRLTRLIPEPYDDGNDSQNADDTPLWSDVWGQMDLYLRAMCEGYVDEESTRDLNNCVESAHPDTAPCETASYGLYDYTFENLCYAAFGGRWLTTLPTTETDWTDAADTRADAPEGHGPLPNTRLAAECHNQLVSALNLLTRVRVMLPYKLEVKEDIYDGQRLVNASEVQACDAAPVDCGAFAHIAWYGQPAAGTNIVSVGAWTPLAPGASVSGSTSALIGGCSGVDYALNTLRTVVQWRLSLVSEDYLHAVPDSWADMLDTGLEMFWCRQHADYVQVRSAGTTDCTTYVFDCQFDLVYDQTAECVFAAAGTVDVGHPPPSWIFWHYDGTLRCSGGSGRYEFLTPIDAVDASGETVPRSLSLLVPLTDPDEFEE